MPGRIQSPSAQLGELLLRGWCMQAEACSDCQLPLMRDPSTMLSHCVGCRKVYNADGNVVQGERQQTPPPAAAAATGSAAAANPPTMNGPVHATTPSSSQPAAAAPIGANGTAAAAAQQPQQSSDDPEFERVQQRYLRMRQQRAAAGAAGASGGSSDPSQLLADRLLEGWTMLAQHCPICNSPLMRSRAMQTRCVVCDLPVQMESSSTAQAAGSTGSTAVVRAAMEQPGSTAAAQQGGTGSTLVAAPAGGDASTEATGGDTGAAVSSMGITRNAGRSAGQPPVRRRANPAPWGISEATQHDYHQQQQPWQEQQQTAGGFGHSGSNLLLQQRSVLSQLQRALLHKLDESRQLLAATAVEQADELDKQLHTINQLMQTFAAVKQSLPQ